MKKHILLLISLIVFFGNISNSEDNGRTFSKDDIRKLAGAYLNYKLNFENPLLVDVDKDGDFDALNFDDGNVEYYMNIGSLESPEFVLENKNYDKYDVAFFIEPHMPFPIFFADIDGDKDMDMFVVKDKEYNKSERKFEYKISTAENSLNLDTGTLITIILVLVIVILILAILGK